VTYFGVIFGTKSVVLNPGYKIFGTNKYMESYDFSQYSLYLISYLLIDYCYGHLGTSAT